MCLSRSEGGRTPNQSGGSQSISLSLTHLLTLTKLRDSAQRDGGEWERGRAQGGREAWIGRIFFIPFTE